MTDAKSGIHEFSLTPFERKRRQDLAGAVHVLQNAIHELQLRVESDEPNLRTRDLVSNSCKALTTIKMLMDSNHKQNHH
jgi:hypothetical protein